jgi:LacI family transcriptional regulator
MGNRVKMQDVARLASVSAATVSAVINGSVKVSDLRRGRVLSAMEALDYHPDQIARSLRMGKTCAVGVIVPDLTNTFYPEVVRGVEEAAHTAGYAVVLCDSNEDPEEEQRHLGTLFSRRVDGVLLACCANSLAHDTMVRKRFPIVWVDSIPRGATERTVCTDNVQAGYLATRHLIDLGHERIALLAGNVGFSSHFDRLAGFRQAMREFQLPVREEYLAADGVQIESGYRATKQLAGLQLSPTAIIATNNKLALGMLKALNELEIRCPENISTVGIDSIQWAEAFRPRLTTVEQSDYELGKRALEMLMQVIALESQAGLPLKNIRLEPTLRVRDSTAPPR